MPLEAKASAEIATPTVSLATSLSSNKHYVISNAPHIRLPSMQPVNGQPEEECYDAITQLRTFVHAFHTQCKSILQK